MIQLLSVQCFLTLQAFCELYERFGFPFGCDVGYECAIGFGYVNFKSENKVRDFRGAFVSAVSALLLVELLI